jgi:TolB-like protein
VPEQIEENAMNDNSDSRSLYTRSAQTGASAAQWFVDLDAEPVDARMEAEFAEWLTRDRAHAAALARCDAAVFLTKQLGDTAKLGLAFGEASRIAADEPARRGVLAGKRAWLSRPSVAWSVAAASLAFAVIAFATRSIVAPAGTAAVIVSGTAAAGSNALAVRDPESVDIGAAQRIAVLPGPIVVDAYSVAVMPFIYVGVGEELSTERASEIASDLHDQVERQLAAIPGMYVLDRRSLVPYVNRDFVPEVMAAQLGVRGVVEARVASADGRVRVALTLTDAARDGLLVQNAFERPVAELTAMRADIVTNIAAALGDIPILDEPTAIQ